MDRERVGRFHTPNVRCRSKLRREGLDASLGVGRMRIGDRILQRYVIDQLAGSGAMGNVFRGRDLALGTVVAIKVLRDPWSEAVPRFQREAEMLRELADPRIVRYHAHGVTPEGEAFLVMEWLEGETLEARLSRPLTGREALSVGRSVAEALVCAHGCGVVHRDLKPANIFLVGGASENVRVVDFGIARMRKPGQTLTATGEILGTPAYMSPEQAGASRDLDARSDLFSLGSILFECFSGRTPFDRPSALALLIALATERAPALRSVAPDVPPRIAAVVDAMLSPDAAGRPPDAAAVVRAFGAAQLDPENDQFLSSFRTAPRLPRSLSLTDSLTSGPTLSPTTGPPRPTLSSSHPTRKVDTGRGHPTRRMGLVGAIAALTLVALVVSGVSLAWGGGLKSLLERATQKSADAESEDLDCSPAIACARVDVEDPKHVDGFALLPQVIRFARTIRPKAEFVNAALFAVTDGSLDLDAGATMLVSTTGRVSIQVKGRRMFAWTIPADMRPNPLPGCPLHKAFDAARKVGLPLYPAATVTAGISDTDSITLTVIDGSATKQVFLELTSCHVR